MQQLQVKDCIHKIFNAQLLFTVLLIVFTQNLNAQSIPAGMPVMEEAMRRAQLLGDIDEKSSFMVRPLNPRKAFGVKESYQVKGRFLSYDSSTSKSTVNFFKDKGRASLLPAISQTQFNSTFHYGWADGPMIPNRGIQQMFAAGAYAAVGPLSIQIRPEFVWAQNRDFERFPQHFSDELWNDRAFFWLISDEPERFGEGSYSKSNIGQSSVRLNFGGISLGVSQENIWWGPGQFNALIFSNNAQGFQHITLNTTRPLKTFIGHFEGQVLSGRLEGSGILNELSGRRPISKSDDWRYLSAMTFSYSPKWVPGLFLGFSRTFQLYSEKLEPNFFSYFPLLEGFQKQQFFQNGSSGGFDERGDDQQVAVSLRWLLQKAHAEFYFEFGRRDHALNWRDFIMSPEHARAYLLGFQKLFSIKPDEFIQVRFEASQTQQSINHMVRYEGEGQGQSWGTHIPVLHGFTHYGQQLGNGIGPGSNVQTLEVSWIKDYKKIGFITERLERQMDFYYRAFRDNSPHRPWIDVGAGAIANWQFNKILLASKLQYVRALNYQWQIQEPVAGSNRYRGVDRSNLHANVSILYLF